MKTPHYVVHMADVILVGNLDSFQRDGVPYVPNRVVAIVPTLGFENFEQRVAMANMIADSLNARAELEAAMMDGTI